MILFQCTTWNNLKGDPLGFGESHHDVMPLPGLLGPIQVFGAFIDGASTARTDHSAREVMGLTSPTAPVYVVVECTSLTDGRANYRGDVSLRDLTGRVVSVSVSVSTTVSVSVSASASVSGAGTGSSSAPPWRPGSRAKGGSGFTL